jgi:hypothetical protein
MLLIEVDASDVGWGACAYQMYKPWDGNPEDEARGRINDTGRRKIIEWISKSWNEHELKLPVFYRETLARLLCLEKFRNLIETNIQSGAALYTDHKPGLFENSLSNKGQLSAWRIAETADLQSLVQTHYRQGPKMLLADPLSRFLCSPSSGFFDPTLPVKLQALLEYLPVHLKKHENVRVYAYTDTAALSRHVQQWRSLKNPISQGRLALSTAKDSLHIGIMHSDESFKELQNLLLQDKPFAILCPVGIISEISRVDNTEENLWNCNKDIDKLVHSLSKLVLSQENMVWLINLHNQDRFIDVLSIENAGCSVDNVNNDIICASLRDLVQEITPLSVWDLHNHEVLSSSLSDQELHDHLVLTRSKRHDHHGNNTAVRRNNRIRSQNVIIDPIQN